MSQSEEIKSKLDIVEVIREYVPVKAVGANFQALCPFHNEKTPSFVISPDKQIWHCFGCGRGGDVFSFVMEKESLGFMEVLRLLAPKAGVVLQYENKEAYSRRNRLLDILELAGKYYHHLLTTSPGKVAREYLLGRQLSEETISAWQLGYSPDAWDSLYNFLKARPLVGQKYSDEEIFLAGLATKKEGGRGYYDRFRDRIMFPIRDSSGNLIAFTARVNPAKEKTEKMGKYINSPQTPVYDKSRVLFALDRAKGEIRKQDLAIVVEGQMDAISAHQHGFTNVVASSGTALTAEQVALIKRFTSNIALCFDMDAAGQMAADRGIKEALAQEMSIKIITLPQGKDPDECLKKDPADFARAVESAQPMLEYYLEKISAGLDLGQLDNQQIVSRQMLSMLSLVHNRLERDFWLHRLAEAVEAKEAVLRESLEKITAKEGVAKKAGREEEKGETETRRREDLLAELLFAFLVRFPDFIGYSISNLEPDFLDNSELSRFYNTLIIYYNKAASLDYEGFRLYLEEQGAGEEKLLDKLVLLGEKDLYSYENERVKAEVIKIIVELKKYGWSRRIRKLEKAIARAEEAGESGELEVLMAELKNLTDQLSQLSSL